MQSICYSKSQITAEFEQGNRYKDPKTMVMFWYHNERMICYLLNEDKAKWTQQLKLFRGQAQKGELFIRKCNSINREYKGRNWYCFVLQYKSVEDNGDGMMNPMDLLIFSRAVSGISYWFSNKQNRDKSQQYIMKGLLAPSIHG